MKPTDAPPILAPTPRVRVWHLTVLAICLLPALCILGVLSYVHVGSDLSALRDSLATSMGSQLRPKVAVSFGGLTLGLVRAGSGFFNLPLEARAAIKAAGGAEVGVYDCQRSPGRVEHSALIATADQVMTGRGWQRLVGVSKDEDLVAVYVPRKGLTAKRVHCCVMVLHEQQLVLARFKANALPLIPLVANQLDRADFGHTPLACR